MSPMFGSSSSSETALQSLAPRPAMDALSRAGRSRLRRHLEQRQQAAQNFERRRRTAWNVQIDRHHGVDAADYGIAAGKTAAIARAVAYRDHPFRIGRGVIGALQRHPHV